MIRHLLFVLRGELRTLTVNFPNQSFPASTFDFGASLALGFVESLASSAATQCPS